MPDMCRAQARIDDPLAGSFPTSTDPTSTVNGAMSTPVLLKGIFDLSQIPISQLAVEVPHNCGVTKQCVGFHHTRPAGLLGVLAHVLQVKTETICIPEDLLWNPEGRGKVDFDVQVCRQVEELLRE
jgi:hypothetical protein